MDYVQLSSNDILEERNFTFSDIPDFDDFQNKKSPLEWIAIGALILSSICLTIHLFAFMILPELRKHSGKYLASLCFAFLVDYLFVVIAHFITPGTPGCKYFAWIMYYSAVVPFLWIGIIGFEMWKNLREALTTVTIISEKRYNRFVCSSLLAWLFPGLGLIVGIIIEQMEPTSVPHCFVPDMGHYVCWFGQSCSAVLFYHGPVNLYVSVAILFLILVGITILAGKKSDETTLDVASKQIKLKPFAVLTILAYVTSIVELLPIFMGDIYFYYISMLLKPILGIYFVIGFTCTGRSHIVEMKSKTKGQSYDIEEA